MNLDRELDQFLMHLASDPIETMVLGCSGGMDSMVLMHALSRRATIKTLVVCYVDHGLHAESQAHQRHVQTHAEILGLDYRVYRADQKLIKSGNGLEDGARLARYACLEACRKSVEAECVALGHHALDQLETFFIRLSQGSGVQGLGGIRGVRGNFVRPLIGCSKADIEAYAQHHGVEYVQDPTNTDKRFLRNSIRSTLIPVLDGTLGVGWRGHLGRLMNELQRRHLDDERRVLDYRQRLVVPVRHGVCLNRKSFAEIGRTDGELLLKSCLDTAFEKGGPKRVHIQALRALAVDGPSTSRVSLGRGLWGVAEYRHLFIGRLFEPHNEQVVVTHNGEFDWRDWRFSFEKPLSSGMPIRVPTPSKAGPIRIRSVAPGDRVVRDGRHKKMSKLLIDCKIPKRLRQELPIIDYRGTIIWVGQLGTFGDVSEHQAMDCTLWVRAPSDFANVP
ncbi:MAG: tRNA lysidine(34) synthetase TilS [Bradymonadia bacterium]